MVHIGLILIAQERPYLAPFDEKKSLPPPLDDQSGRIHVSVFHEIMIICPPCQMATGITGAPTKPQANNFGQTKTGTNALSFLE